METGSSRMTPRVAFGSRAGTSSVAAAESRPENVPTRSGRYWRSSGSISMSVAVMRVAITAGPSRRPWPVPAIRASGNETSPRTSDPSAETSTAPRPSAKPATATPSPDSRAVPLIRPSRTAALTRASTRPAMLSPSGKSGSSREVERAGVGLHFSRTRPSPVTPGRERRVEHPRSEVANVQPLRRRLEADARLADWRDGGPSQIGRCGLPGRAPGRKRPVELRGDRDRTAAPGGRRQPGRDVLQTHLLRADDQVHRDDRARRHGERRRGRPRQVPRCGEPPLPQTNAGRRETQ